MLFEFVKYPKKQKMDGFKLLRKQLTLIEASLCSFVAPCASPAGLPFQEMHNHLQEPGE